MKSARIVFEKQKKKKKKINQPKVITHWDDHDKKLLKKLTKKNGKKRSWVDVVEKFNKKANVHRSQNAVREKWRKEMHNRIKVMPPWDDHDKNLLRRLRRKENGELMKWDVVVEKFNKKANVPRSKQAQTLKWFLMNSKNHPPKAIIHWDNHDKKLLEKLRKKNKWNVVIEKFNQKANVRRSVNAIHKKWHDMNIKKKKKTYKRKLYFGDNVKTKKRKTMKFTNENSSFK